MQNSLMVCLLAVVMLCISSIDAHGEKLFGILDRLLGEREVSIEAHLHRPTTKNAILRICLHVPMPSSSKVYHYVNGDGENGFCTHSESQCVRRNWPNDKR